MSALSREGKVRGKSVICQSEVIHEAAGLYVGDRSVFGFCVQWELSFHVELWSNTERSTLERLTVFPWKSLQVMSSLSVALSFPLKGKIFVLSMFWLQGCHIKTLTYTIAHTQLEA